MSSIFLFLPRMWFLSRFRQSWFSLSRSQSHPYFTFFCLSVVLSPGGPSTPIVCPFPLLVFFCFFLLFRFQFSSWTGGFRVLRLAGPLFPFPLMSSPCLPAFHRVFYPPCSVCFLSRHFNAPIFFILQVFFPSSPQCQSVFFLVVCGRCLVRQGLFWMPSGPFFCNVFSLCLCRFCLATTPVLAFSQFRGAVHSPSTLFLRLLSLRSFLLLLVTPTASSVFPQDLSHAPRETRFRRASRWVFWPTFFRRLESSPGPRF